MDLSHPLDAAVALVVLALLDSSSIGTLVLPVATLLRPGPSPVRRVLLHLAVVAGCYAAAGAVLLAVGTSLWRAVGAAPVVPWMQLVVGVALFALSFGVDSGRRRRQGRPDRTTEWLARADRLSGGGTAVLAGTAVVVELATMVPYLAALGILGAADWPAPATGAALVGYCLVMVAPALVLLAARTVLADRVTPALRRLEAWTARHGDSALGWGMGIGGFLLARHAVGRLGGWGRVLEALPLVG
ncbi:hypothetical protein GTR02_18300 [Kineococcus sp. R8]|uniref:GAP family protein n=1 Tax=Kineococcus siccus TaxID=2696567 RepID=UPI0014135AA2|nr:GAP family protein [Kineococcus siccus]NAZ83768.1 hypothetical protein [Kineococcus siccus]